VSRFSSSSSSFKHSVFLITLIVTSVAAYKRSGNVVGLELPINEVNLR